MEQIIDHLIVGYMFWKIAFLKVNELLLENDVWNIWHTYTKDWIHILFVTGVIYGVIGNLSMLREAALNGIAFIGGIIWGIFIGLTLPIWAPFSMMKYVYKRVIKNEPNPVKEKLEKVQEIITDLNEQSDKVNILLDSDKQGTAKIDPACINDSTEEVKPVISIIQELKMQTNLACSITITDSSLLPIGITQIKVPSIFVGMQIADACVKFSHIESHESGDDTVYSVYVATTDNTLSEPIVVSVGSVTKPYEFSLSHNTILVDEASIECEYGGYNTDNKKSTLIKEEPTPFGGQEVNHNVEFTDSEQKQELIEKCSKETILQLLKEDCPVTSTHKLDCVQFKGMFVFVLNNWYNKPVQNLITSTMSSVWSGLSPSYKDLMIKFRECLNTLEHEDVRTELKTILVEYLNSLDLGENHEIKSNYFYGNILAWTMFTCLRNELVEENILTRVNNLTWQLVKE